MQLALFDLDHTILNIDSDYSWGEFIVQEKLVDEAYYRDKNANFYQDYIAGVLDPVAYNEFVFETFIRVSKPTLLAMRDVYLKQVVIPSIRPQAVDHIQSHKNNQHIVAIITATNAFITKPIAEYLGVDHLIATEPEMVNGVFTGKVKGRPCFQVQKLSKLNEWLAQQVDSNIERSWAYSDSFNDLPLLNFVDFPTVVNPDSRLLAYAQSRDWPINDWAIR